MKAKDTLLACCIPVAVAATVTGCAGQIEPGLAAETAPGIVPPVPAVDPRITTLETSLTAARTELAQAKAAAASLERDLAASRGEVATLQERYAALEARMARTQEAHRTAEPAHQTVAVTETHAQSSDVIPIVPPRRLQVTTNANLRRGPGLDQLRVAVLPAGSLVGAEARAGDWYRIRTDAGVVAWIFGSLVQPME